MIIKTRIFELSQKYYRNLSELAQAMEISVSQVYRVREGKRHVNQKFIIGATKAFPGHKFDDLFYFAPQPSLEMYPTTRLVTKTQGMESPQQELERVTSATQVYAQRTS